MPLTFGLLLNLAGVCHAEGPEVMWAYVSRYAPGASSANSPLLDKLVKYAVAYYQDFVKPTKTYRTATPEETAALIDLRNSLTAHTGEPSPELLQTLVFEVGKRHAATFPGLRDWFKALYQILLGQDQGPRMGSFIALYGLQESLALLGRAIKGDNFAA